MVAIVKRAVAYGLRHRARPLAHVIGIDEVTGTTPFTLSRLLSAWETCGMVRPRREGVMICDVESLREMSQYS